jgi:hypothetical protein
MSNFFAEKGRTRGYDEAYFSYVEEVNPRRTPLSGKRAIFGWKLVCEAKLHSPQWYANPESGSISG